jgi:hypothetical protein
VRVRMGIIVVALGLALTACSDGSEPEASSGQEPSGSSTSAGEPDAPETDVGTLECPEYEAIATRIVDTQSQLYAPSSDADPQEAIDQLLGELESLQQGAPAGVQEAVTNLAAGFRQAAELLASPEGQNQTELLTLATALSEDSQKITSYIAQQCEAG